MAAPLVKVAVWSDIACPWCYIGKRRLDKALAQLRQQKGVGGKVEWHAFLLDPNFQPATGADIDEYGRKRFGPGFAAMKQRVVENGRPDGAAFADWKWRAHTLKGHMLVALARQQGKDHEAAELLFQATYEKGDNVSDTGVLLRIASELGLEQEARKALGAPAAAAPAGAGASGVSTAAAAAGSGPSAVGEGEAGGADGLACSPDGVCRPVGAGAAAAAAGAAGQGNCKQQEEEEEGEGLDGELLKAVQLDVAMAKSRLQITGVPFFVVSVEGGRRQMGLSGAQPVDAFLEVFDAVLKEAAQQQ